MDEDRLTKLVALAAELARSPHEPEDYARCAAETATGALKPQTVARVLSFLPIGAAAGLACRRWRCVASSPALWEQLARRAGDAAAALAARRCAAEAECLPELAQLETATRSLSAAPGASCAALRDRMAAAARRAARRPTDCEFRVLDACCKAAGAPTGSARAFRAALDGDARQGRGRGARPPKLAVALRRLDVAALSLGDDARAHERLYALALATSEDRFPAAADAARTNVQLGRLAAWCVAAANLRDRLVSVARDAPSSGDAPPAAAASRCEAAMRDWLRLCAKPPAEAPPPAPARRRSSFGASPRRRARQSASQPPPSPSLLALFAAEKRPTASSPPSKRGADCAATLRRFYARHNPALAPRAAAIAREWRGAEPTLFALLRYKYKRGAGAGAPPAVAAAVDDAERAVSSRPPRASSSAAVGRRRSSSARPPPSAAAASRERGASAREVALATLRGEIDRLKSSVSTARQESDRAKCRAAAAAATTRRLKGERDAAKEAGELEVERLREEAAVLKRETERRDGELEALRRALEDARSRPAKPPPAAPNAFALSPLRTGRKSVRAPPPGGDAGGSGDLAVDAVLAAVCDVLLAEAATELDFELEFGLSEAQLLGLAPLPEDVAPPPPPQHRSRSIARSPGTPTRKTRSQSPTRVMPLVALDDVGDDASSPRTANTRTPPGLDELEDSLAALTSALTPNTARAVLDGMEGELASIC